MNRAYLAGVLSGFAGGVMGAWLLPYLSDSKSHGMMAAAAAAQPQEVLSARRIQLREFSSTIRPEGTASCSACTHRAKASNRSWC